MKKALMIMMVVGLCLGFTGMAMALDDTTTQTMDLNVNEIAVLDDTGDPGALTIVAPATGGQTPADVTDNSTYAQYTSVITTGQTRKLTAQISVAAPAGTQLTLEASGLSGTEGSAVAKATLGTVSAVDIVTGIGSCATGIGATDGAQLTYGLEVTDVTALVVTSGTAPVVTLTLTAGA